jgi:hypothetical protein
MAKVFDYSKSSCNCYKCADYTYSYVSKGVPTNMSIRNCETPEMLECYDRKLFRSDIEPTNEPDSYAHINPQVVHNNYANDFKQINCSDNTTCPSVQYASKDPRLISVAHSGQVLTLDRPPINGSVDLSKISTDTGLDGYGQKYNTYSDINAGDILYYINKSRKDPFYTPLFSTSANVYGTLYRDPMGVIRPQYEREPLKHSDPFNTTKESYDGCLSWIRDSQEHREDILSKNMRKYNEQRWEPRWEI